MFKAAIILLLISIALAVDITQNVKRISFNSKLQASLKSRKHLGIIGGNSTTINKHPYQASLLIFGYYRCAAAIVHKNYVLTLADCVFKHSAYEFQVRVGSSYVEKGGTLYDVKSLITHPQYSYYNSSYDLALVKVKKPIKFSNKVKKISLATKDLAKNEKVVISGWGDTIESNSDSFHDASLAGVARSECNATYSTMGGNVDESMICAAASGVGPCTDDFGDPITSQDKLFGVFAWSLGCAVDGYPSVYASVPAVASWIKKTIKS